MNTSNQLHYFAREWITPSRETLDVDVCIYGGTAAGVIAGIATLKKGKTALLLQPGRHLGGMTTGGLGWTDFGRKHVIGGMSRQFYVDVGKHYNKPEEWQFEPHVATAVLEKYIADAGLPVRRCQYLDEVHKQGNRILALTLLGGLTVRAKMFIDATYEGDLLAYAGVTYTVGRESNATYGEELNGIQVHNSHQFSHPVDPYVQAGVPASGLLPQVEAMDLSKVQGQGDKRVQAYCFRMCMTDDPALKIAWEKPAGFDPLQYVLATRWFQSEKDKYNEQVYGRMAGATPVPGKFDIFPSKTPGGHHKTDTNNHGPVSSDFIGANWAWPEADYETRERIFQAHVTYQKGLYWHLANDPAIPQRYREAYSAWGLPKDEFLDTGHWPHQLYVREARRMLSAYVVTEHDCRRHVRATDSVGMGSYTMDSHNCTRFVTTLNGVTAVRNDGDVQVPPTDPYPMSYRAITPHRRQCANLLVPVCFAASHIAYGSARMEPVFMVLGESSAYAASQALDQKTAVQDIDYPTLRRTLEQAGQILEIPASK